MSSKKKQNTDVSTLKKGEEGFTMIEAIIAILILTIGLIGTAAALTFALEFGAISKNVTNGKMFIVSTIEEIESLRNARRLDYKQIENIGKVNNDGSPNLFDGFSTGYKEVSLNPGPDGVNGTNDDLKDPGADGKFGTTDDFDNPALVRSGYMRQITISNISPTIKKIEVKVRYFSVGGKVGEITGICYLNDEARITR